MTLSLPRRSSASFVRQDRAERVSVRVLVRDEQEVVVGADRVGDRTFDVTCVPGSELIDQLRHPHPPLD